MLNHAIRGMSFKSVNGVKIYYNEEADAAVVERALVVLRDHDYIAYQYVKQHISAVVCCGGLPSWNAGKSAASIGIRLGIYFDELTPLKRKSIDERRYGCILLRCALLVRLLKQFQISTSRFGGQTVNKRIWDLVNRRDIACCEKLGCEMKYIYELQRWIRGK
jgi:hypothetical protein